MGTERTVTSDAKYFSELTPVELELLALLSEECGELVQIIGKVMRHGLHSCHPRSGAMNINSLIQEMGDVRAAMELLCNYRVVGSKAIQEAETAKLEKVGRYLHHATDMGRHRRNYLPDYRDDSELDT